MAQFDDLLSSDIKREGMKYITQMVYSILRDSKECTYQEICRKIAAQNSETANRRVYDVLNVMRAVNIVGKKNKTYFLVDGTDDIRAKRNEKKKLVDMKETFIFITSRNELLANIHSEKLYLPFMVISADKKSEIHCDTNEERSFFNFKSNKPLKVMEDLDVLKEIREQAKRESKGYPGSITFDSFLF